MLIKRWKGRHIAPQLRFIDGADIIHCYSGDLAGSAPERLVRERQIPGLAAWQGSEIRMPSIESQTNPYYHLILDEDGISPFGDDGLSRIRQQKMYELGFEPLVTAGMRQYILPEYTGPIHQIFHPVSLDSEPAYPELNNLRPLIVHIPSKERVKGSLYVRRAIERIRPLADFEYIEATGIPRTEVLDLMRRCDIYIDQMILGDHGMASLEAMSYGKPVVCYLKPSVLELLPADIPIVNATIDDLSEKLLELIKDPQMRCDLGQASRAYVKKYHDPYKLAVRLDGIYRDVLSRKGHNAVA
ncbi:MAG: glycosyltransferase [Coriobacteriia bacterium]|nr:glycosyltransferase [Coriobacteriia bacterium]